MCGVAHIFVQDYPIYQEICINYIWLKMKPTTYAIGHTMHFQPNIPHSSTWTFSFYSTNLGIFKNVFGPTELTSVKVLGISFFRCLCFYLFLTYKLGLALLMEIPDSLCYKRHRGRIFLFVRQHAMHI